MPFAFSSRIGALRASRPSAVASAASRPLCSSGGNGGGGGKSSINAAKKVGEDDNDGSSNFNASRRVAVGAALLVSPLAAAVRPARAGPVRASSSSSASAGGGGGLEKIKSSLKGAGLSVLLGYAAAALIKTVGKTAATIAFLAWALVQYLSSKKVFSLDWEGMFKKVGSRAAWLLDLDRDGSVGVGDLKAAVSRASRLVGKTKASSGAAFVAGLAWGLGVLPLL